MTKEIILAIVATFLVAGLAGFYGGRFYERKITRNRFTHMRQNAGQKQGPGNGFFMNMERPDGSSLTTAPSDPATNKTESSTPSSK